MFQVFHKLFIRFAGENRAAPYMPSRFSPAAKGPCPFSANGAACNLEGNDYEQATIMVFDDTGTRYTYMLDNGRWLSVENITNLANGSSPFNLAGVGAMAFRTKDPPGPSTRVIFNKDGALWTIYNNNPQGFTSPKNLNQLFSSHNFPSGMDGVGASIGFDIGDGHFYIFFDKTGRKWPFNPSNHLGPKNAFRGLPLSRKSASVRHSRLLPTESEGGRRTRAKLLTE